MYRGETGCMKTLGISLSSRERETLTLVFPHSDSVTPGITPLSSRLFSFRLVRTIVTKWKNEHPRTMNVGFVRSLPVPLWYYLLWIRQGISSSLWVSWKDLEHNKTFTMVGYLGDVSSVMIPWSKTFFFFEITFSWPFLCPPLRVQTERVDPRPSSEMSVSYWYVLCPFTLFHTSLPGTFLRHNPGTGHSDITLLCPGGSKELNQGQGVRLVNPRCTLSEKTTKIKTSVLNPYQTSRPNVWNTLNVGPPGDVNFWQVAKRRKVMTVSTCSNLTKTSRSLTIQRLVTLMFQVLKKGKTMEICGVVPCGGFGRLWSLRRGNFCV